ncbi:MAG: hypothetical protein H6883_07300 [Rhodobiaceae bacterium]|nr:hypothetical protein [Rhodobiaceae bacterium]MCC0055926.1 hypothetical protein [Rhodobiaceae bacterium]
MTEEEAEGRIKFDKRISLGNVLQLIAMIGGAALVWATLNANIAVMRNEIDTAKTDRLRLEQRVVKVEAARDDMRDRMIRVEIQLQAANQTISKIAEAVGAK